LARPEIAPPAEACPAERRLHDALLADPRRPVAPAEIAAIADPDARENWELMIAWRDHLVRQRTLEAGYLDIVRRARQFPPIFIDQLVQLILRNALDGCEDAFVLRASELFFRPQKLALQDGSLVAADEETARGLGAKPLSPLDALLRRRWRGSMCWATAMPPAIGSAVISRYGLDLTAGRRGLAALGDVMMRWVSHLAGIEVEIEPILALQEVALTWYVGLDAAATRLGDALWNGEVLDEAAQARVVGLYRLSFRDSGDVIERLAGEPVYLILAMTADKLLRVKPQNLVTGLPVRQREMVS
jgi:hypothetical protein